MADTASTALSAAADHPHAPIGHLEKLAAIQRRHLMVWAVFAPRFVFAAALQGVAALSSVLLWALVFSGATF